MRDYGIPGQIGLEPTPAAFVATMVEVFREVKRVLRKDGTLWLNLGDSYANAGQTGNDRRGTLDNGGKPHYTPIAGLKPKDLLGMPWRVAFALQEDGWYLRSAITWCKRAPMPESVTDRPTSATEMIFLLTRAERYYYDADAVRTEHKPESLERYKHGFTRGKMAGDGLVMADAYQSVYGNPAGRNLWNYWLLGPEPYAAAHFATFPTAIPDRCIRAGTSERGVCPQCGAPWKRVVVTSGGSIGAAWHDHENDLHRGQRANAKTTDGTYKRESIGWQPTCKCNAAHQWRRDIPPDAVGGGGAAYDAGQHLTSCARCGEFSWHPSAQAPCRVPAVVLDPFSGAGTTALVALRLGRSATGIELNGEYIAMSHKRIQGDPQAMNLNMQLEEIA
jgi:DNA modification methylase